MITLRLAIVPRAVGLVARSCLCIIALMIGHSFGFAQNSTIESSPVNSDAGSNSLSSESVPARKKVKPNVGATEKPVKKVKPDKSNKSNPLFRNETFTLYPDSIVEGEREATAVGGKRVYLINALREMVRPNVSGKYPSLQTSNPIVDSLYRIALADLEMNVVRDARGAYFRVSPDFPNTIFTRDTAYSSHLGASLVFPGEIKSHLRIDRELRRSLGFRCPIGESLPYQSVVNEVEPLNAVEFSEKYGTTGYSRRTDDPCWILGFWSAWQVDGDRSDVEWMLSEFEYFDEEFYRRLHDPKDGLYFGQASFFDIGGTAYPDEYSLQDCLNLKALSTNALYVAAFDIVARAYDSVQQIEKSKLMRLRSERLRTAILDNFKHPDGYLAFYRHTDGRLEPRRDQLGTSFAILFSITDREAGRKLVSDYPANDFGSPAFFPFQPTNKVYHNRAIWPFSDTYFQRAKFVTADSLVEKEQVLMTALGTLSRNALWGNFTEVMDYETGGWEEKHARSYIWSAAAYLGLIFHDFAGIQLDDDGLLRLSPILPRDFGGRLELNQVHVRGSILDIQIVGSGETIKSFIVDGVPQSTNSIHLDGRPHRVQIELGL